LTWGGIWGGTLRSSREPGTGGGVEGGGYSAGFCLGAGFVGSGGASAFFGGGSFAGSGGGGDSFPSAFISELGLAS
jgi:hypothetical protein